MKNHTGHRWTDEELKRLIAMWLSGVGLEEVAGSFGITMSAVTKQVTRMRRNGIPLPHRKRGNKAGRRQRLWTQEEVEYIVRRRRDGITAEQLAIELDRTFYGVQAMVLKLRKEGVAIRSLGGGRTRLYNVDTLREAVAGRHLAVVSEDVS